MSFPVSEIGLKNGRMENMMSAGFSRNLNVFTFFSAEIEPGIERVRMLKQTRMAVALKMFFFQKIGIDVIPHQFMQWFVQAFLHHFYDLGIILHN